MEFNAYTGICEFCGREMEIMAADQIDADGKVAKDCPCEGHARSKRLDRAKGLINEYFGDKCVKAGLRPVSGEALRLLHMVAEGVNDEVADSVSVTIGPLTKCVISMTSKGKINVARTDTSKCQGGA